MLCRCTGRVMMPFCGWACGQRTRKKLFFSLTRRDGKCSVIVGSQPAKVFWKHSMEFPKRWAKEPECNLIDHWKCLCWAQTSLHLHFQWIKKAAVCTMLWEARTSMQGVRYRNLCEQEWEKNLAETDLQREFQEAEEYASAARAPVPRGVWEQTRQLLPVLNWCRFSPGLSPGLSPVLVFPGTDWNPGQCGQLSPC